MKVLFAVSNEEISEAIVKRYQKQYKEILSYKNVYYFNAILKEIQKDKTYDRIVISEELEAFTNTQYEQIDRFIFDKLDSISDEAANTRGDNTPIILICSDRRAKGEEMLVKLFGIGIYDALIGNDRGIDEVCNLIYKPRSKKEAKLYYKIEAEDVKYQAENENDVSEQEIQNIIAHYKKLGKNEEKYVTSFDNIVAQYNDAQLRIISKFLPLNVRAVLEEKSPKYQQIMSFNNAITDSIRKPKNQKQASLGPSGKLLRPKNNTVMPTEPIVIPNSVDTENVRKLTRNNSNTVDNGIQGIEEETDSYINFSNNNISENDIEDPVKRSLRVNKIPEPEEMPAPAPKRRGRPRKNPIEEPKKNVSSDYDTIKQNQQITDDTILPGFQEQNDWDYNQSNTLPGFEQNNDYDEEMILPGFEKNDNLNDETMLPGFEQDNNSFEEKTLPGFEQNYSQKSNFENTQNKSNNEKQSQYDPFSNNQDFNNFGFDSTFNNFDNPSNSYNNMMTTQEENNVSEYNNNNSQYANEQFNNNQYDEKKVDSNQYSDEKLDNNHFSNNSQNDDNMFDSMQSSGNIFDNSQLNNQFENSQYINNSNNQYENKLNNYNNNGYDNMQMSGYEVNSADLSRLLTDNKKIAAFVGTSKNGTSFIINNLAEYASSMGINVAILDTTKNKNSYYIYTKNEEELRQIAEKCLENLSNGQAKGINVNKNLTVYTSLPEDREELNNVNAILETLIRVHDLILIDCDFNTPYAYFASAQEIYLVQSYDILTIQPLTAFLRELKAQNILDQNKLKILLNKHVKVRGISEKTIVGGMSKYNDPAMSFMTDLFDVNAIKYMTIQFEPDIYTRYLESVINCDVSIKGYSKTFMQTLKELCNWIYHNSMGNNSYRPQTSSYNNTAFSTNMNDTLNQMRRKY